MIIVSDTSPITNLAAIQTLNLLESLYESIIIPVAVHQPFFLGYNNPEVEELHQRNNHLHIVQSQHKILACSLTFPQA